MVVVTVGLSALCVSGRAMGSQAAARVTATDASDEQPIAKTDCTASSSVRLRKGKVVFRAATACHTRHYLTLDARFYLVKGGVPGPWVAASDGIALVRPRAQRVRKLVGIDCRPGTNSYLVRTKQTAVSRRDGRSHNARTESIATFAC